MAATMAGGSRKLKYEKMLEKKRHQMPTRAPRTGRISDNAPRGVDAVQREDLEANNAASLGDAFVSGVQLADGEVSEMLFASRGRHREPGRLECKVVLMMSMGLTVATRCFLI